MTNRVPNQCRHPDSPFGIQHRRRLFFDGPQPHQADHNAANSPVSDKEVRSAQDEQRDLVRTRLPNHQTDIFNIRRLTDDIRRPSDLKRGVRSQRSLERCGSPETRHRSAHICLRELRMSFCSCPNISAPSRHRIIRSESIGPTTQPPSSKYPLPLTS